MVIPRTICEYFNEYGKSFYGLTGANIYCDETIRDDVLKSFIDIWKKEWAEATDEYDFPDYDTEFTDYGIKFLTYSVNIYGGGEQVDPDCWGERHFKSALRMLRNKFPSIDIYANVITWGQVGDYDYPIAMEFSSKPDEDHVYDFIGEYLREMNWKEFCDNFDEIMSYEIPEDTYGNYYNNDNDIEEVNDDVEDFENNILEIISKMENDDDMNDEDNDDMDDEEDEDDMSMYDDIEGDYCFISEHISVICHFFYKYDKYVPQKAFDTMLEYAVIQKSVETVANMSSKITKNNIDRLIEISQKNKKTELTARLLNFKNENIGFSNE